jgi:GT2 family glycosyltransferase
MDATPLVSVIVLNYNGAAIIGRCLDHLLAQTYPNVQLIAVDNASRDDSPAILDRYAADDGVTVVRSDANLGCAGGRNLGLAAAQGDIVAFMDNDGYASPTWLAEAVGLLAGNASIGAVAALVFFNGHKLILNGAGGTLNQRGYGGDFCFKEPFEFAHLPHHVLYPMGCGMVVRRHVLDAMGGFDVPLFNYYDDVEVGLWVWRLGLEVALAPEAWVDHDFGGADAFNRNKVLLCERNRIRTVLKYFPIPRLPHWLLHELASLVPRRGRASQTIPYSAWAWNLSHLPSALRRRLRFRRGGPGGYWPLVHSSWGSFPPARPENQLNRADPSSAAAELAADDDGSALNFGWYPVEHEPHYAMRWTSAAASAYVRISSRVSRMEVTWRAPSGDQQTVLRLRAYDRPATAWQTVDAPPTRWETRRYPCSVAPGVYELQLLTDPPYRDIGGRELGVGIARVAFPA